MIIAVLDTNILVSSLLAPGPPAVIVDLIADGRLIPVYNDLILQEYRDVLSRRKFAFSATQIIRLIDNITKAGIAFKRQPPSKMKMLDDEDRVFYDTAAQAKAYLVTGNTKHFPGQPFIVTPAQFLLIYRKAETENSYRC